MDESSAAGRTDGERAGADTERPANQETGGHRHGRRRRRHSHRHRRAARRRWQARLIYLGAMSVSAFGCLLLLRACKP